MSGDSAPHDDAAGDQTVALLEAWCRGDQAALERLVRSEADWIRARIRKRRGARLADQCETMDQFQELMLGVLAYVPRFVLRNRGELRALLGRMIENDLIDAARKRQRRRDLQQQTLAESQLQMGPTRAQLTGASEAAARNEELAWIRIGLEFLATDQRRLVERHIFGGRTFSELTSEFDSSPNALRNRYNRAIVKLSSIIPRLQSGDIEALDAEAHSEEPGAPA